ncbi:MAG: flagellar hook-length control protein FliK [Gammaproteobacteria bacterium]|nr:flagellar hook-length control protein FliK [Gammaproteobacteria bacterium]
MLTDLAFLQLPPQITGESDGLSQLALQPVENSEFSTFLPIVEQTLLPVPGSVSGQLSAVPWSDPTSLEVLSGGQLLPPSGEPLPPPAIGQPLAVEIRAADIATLQQVTEPGVTVSLATAQPAMAKSATVRPEPKQLLTTPMSTVPLDTARAAAAPLNAAHQTPAPLTTVPFATSQDVRGGSPAAEFALERQLPPQLAIALTQVRSTQSITAATPVEVYHDSIEPGVEEVQLRPVANDRSITARSSSAPTIILNAERPGWQPTLGERLVWMVSHGQQRAEIKLDPPQLGRVDVQIVMQGERAQLVFAAETSVSRELLEQSLPRLREMMADAGVDLASVDVANRERQSAQRDDGYRENGTELPGQAPQAVSEIDSLDTASGNTALLDLFV